MLSEKVLRSSLGAVYKQIFLTRKLTHDYKHSPMELTELDTRDPVTLEVVLMTTDDDAATIGDTRITGLLRGDDETTAEGMHEDWAGTVLICPLVVVIRTTDDVAATVVGTVGPFTIDRANNTCLKNH